MSKLIRFLKIVVQVLLLTIFVVKKIKKDQKGKALGPKCLN
jgi:hypothetical protein